MWYNDMSHHVSACPVNSSCQAKKRIPTFVKLKSKDSFEEVKETKPMQAWSFEHTPENCAKGNLPNWHPATLQEPDSKRQRTDDGGAGGLLCCFLRMFLSHPWYLLCLHRGCQPDSCFFTIIVAIV